MLKFQAMLRYRNFKRKIEILNSALKWFSLLGFLTIGAKWASADAMSDFLKLSKNCGFAPDTACVQKNLKLFEKYIFADGAGQKFKEAKALLDYYESAGKTEQYGLLQKRMRVYERTFEMRREYDAKYLTDAPMGMVPGPGFHHNLAEFLDSQGPDFAADAAAARKDEKFFTKQAKNNGQPSALEQVGSAINAGLTGRVPAPVQYPAPNGGEASPTATPQPPIAPTASSGVNGNGQCTEVNQYVTERTRAVRDLPGPNPVEVFPSFTNNYGDVVTCAFFVHKNGSYNVQGGFGGYTYDVDTGKTSSLFTVGIPSDNGQIQWACYPKVQNDANSCLNKKTNWTP